MAFTATALFVVFLIFSFHVLMTEAACCQPKLCPESCRSLKFVAIVSRHGNRSPISTYPNDPYPYNNSMFWPNGPSELTNIGKTQLYHTGQYLRMRYGCIIDLIYKTKEANVTYNPYDRDFMSAACLTAGMYPPAGIQIWNPALPWQPVLQSLRPFDICDLAYTDACPRFVQLYNNETDKFDENSNEYSDLLEYVSWHTGKLFNKLSDLDDIYDTLRMQELNHYKLPQWTYSIYPSQLRPIGVSYLNQVYGGNKELIKLGAGPELKFICDMLNMKANGTYSSVEKFYIEVAHDCSIIALQRALGNKNPYLEIQPAAFLIFELHFLNPHYIVKFFYFKTTYDTNPDIIDVEGCPNPCTLESFNKLVDHINPPNWTEACQI